MFRFPSCSCQMISRPILKSKWTTISLTSKVFWVNSVLIVFNRNVPFLSDVFFYCVFVCVHRENMPSHFKFKEYCPLVFRNLRERFAIDDQDFLVWKHTVIKYKSCNVTMVVQYNLLSELCTRLGWIDIKKEILKPMHYPLCIWILWLIN